MTVLTSVDTSTGNTTNPVVSVCWNYYWLRHWCPHGWIGWNGPQVWPPRSPDLSLPSWTFCWYHPKDLSFTEVNRQDELWCLIEAVGTMCDVVGRGYRRVQLKCDGTRWRTGGGKWRGNWWMEWVASTLHTTSEHGVSSITTGDAHTSAASSRLNGRPPADLNGLVRFARKTKSGFCACAITFEVASTRRCPCRRTQLWIISIWNAVDILLMQGRCGLEIPPIWQRNGFRWSTVMCCTG